MASRQVIGLVLACGLLACGVVSAAVMRPALLFDAPSVESEGFNREALDGALAFQRLHGVTVDVVTNQGAMASDGNTVAQVERVVAGGADPVIMVGFQFREAALTVAPRHPRVRFVLLDAIADAANILSVSFREEEGAFLVGAMAALRSKSQTIGFVGGMDIPVIRRFGCGYAHGAHHVKPGIRVLARMNGNTPAAFSDSAGAAAATGALVDMGADVIFHAAGVAGVGVIEQASALGKLAIGVDVNQNALAPGAVLSSMLKRMDVAVYLVLRDINAGRWHAGKRELGLRENAVGWSLDRHNILLVDEAMHLALTDLKYSLLDGSLAAYRYREKFTCPYVKFPAIVPPAP